MIKPSISSSLAAIVAGLTLVSGCTALKNQDTNFSNYSVLRSNSGFLNKNTNRLKEIRNWSDFKVLEEGTKENPTYLVSSLEEFNGENIVSNKLDFNNPVLITRSFTQNVPSYFSQMQKIGKDSVGHNIFRARVPNEGDFSFTNVVSVYFDGKYRPIN